MNKKGFTLVELMIVVAILGILAAVAGPMYSGYITAAKRAEAKSNLETLRLLEEQWYADMKTYVGGADTNALMSINGFGFEPGNPADLNYNYKVTASGATFTATATSKTTPSHALEINEKNQKTGW